MKVIDARLAELGITISAQSTSLGVNDDFDCEDKTTLEKMRGLPLDDIPEAMRIVALLDPLTYGVDGLRGALTGIYYFNPLLDLAVLSISTFIFLIIGSKLFSRIQI